MAPHNDGFVLNSALNSVRALVDVLDLDLDLDRGRDRGRSRALKSALALVRDLDRESARALDLESALVRVLALVRVVDRALCFDSARALDRALVAELEDYRAQVRVIMESMEQARVLAAQVPRLPAAGGGGAGVRAPWEVAVWITRWLVRALPAPDQATYREIYGSELFELAQSARPRRAQLGYTLHCLAGVVSLRRALRMPAPAPRRQRW